MYSIRHFFRSFAAMIVLVTGLGLIPFALAMADLYRSPVPLALVPVGAVMAYAGRKAERRADNLLVLEQASGE